MNPTLIEQLDRLFDAHSVAVIGASNSFGTWGFGVMNTLLNSGERKIWPVTKKASEVCGLKAYSNIAEVPQAVDLAVIAIPSGEVPKVMEECVDKGVKAALIISAGLAELGEEGRGVEEEILRIARSGGLRFIGPNSMGHMDNYSQFSTLAWMKEIREGPIGFISQSGTYGQRVVRTGLASGLGFSKFISSGNEADLHLEDYLEYLAQDKQTKIIALYVEGLREGRRFFQLAKEITQRKPIVAMKSGRTTGSAKAARSHVAALAGSDTSYEAMFKQSGVIRVENDDELFDVAMALLHLPLPQGRRVGILTEGGGIGVVAAEACERVGLEIPSFSSLTWDRLNALLPPRWSHGNPADMTDVITAGELVTFPCLWAIMEDENVDAAMVIGGIGATVYFRRFYSPENPTSSLKEKLEPLIESLEDQERRNSAIINGQINKYQKPVVITKLFPEVMVEPEIFNLLREKGVPIYPNPQRAAKVLAHLAWYGEYLNASAG